MHFSDIFLKNLHFSDFYLENMHFSDFFLENMHNFSDLVFCEEGRNVCILCIPAVFVRFTMYNVLDKKILNYLLFLQKPMDLSTIEKKLSSQTYRTTKRFVSDFNLMINNCYQFSGVDSGKII